MNVEPMVNTQVQTTTDYFLFKIISGNRKLNKLHAKRLEKSIKEEYLFTVILVNENYEIIDGQHRFEIIKKLGLPLNYIVCKGYGLNEVHRLNQNTKNWNADDYMNGYCDLGYIDYIKYRRFKNDYKFGHAECMSLLSGWENTTNGEGIKRFYNGDFKIKDYSGAVKKAEIIYSFKDIYPGFMRRSFVFAIVRMIRNEKFIFSEFLRKVKISPTALVDCSTQSQYIDLFEKIYNYRRRDKVNLRFAS